MKYIVLTQGKRVMVDNDDFEWLSKFKWQYQKGTNGKRNYQGYAKRGVKCIRMHREIMKAPKGIEVDHISGNKLDNRKKNLRLVDDFQQNQNSPKRRDNTSGCRGVNYFKLKKTWMARIQYKNKRIFLGYFHKKEDAIKVYKNANKGYFGAFSRLKRLRSIDKY